MDYRENVKENKVINHECNGAHVRIVFVGYLKVSFPQTKESKISLIVQVKSATIV